MEWTLDFGALALLVAGTLLGFKVRQRRFNRTNAFGVERFPSFGEKVRARSIEYFITGTSIALLVTGTIMLSSNHIDSWGWMVMVPVCLFMLYLLLGT